MAKSAEYDDLDLLDHLSRLEPTTVKSYLPHQISNSFKVLHINMRSLVHKMHLLEFLLSQLDIEFSCIVLSETWFSESEYFPKYFLHGYNLFCSSRPEGGGGGTCVYMSDKLEASATVARLAGAEAMTVRIGSRGCVVSSVVAVYRTPSVGPSDFLVDLEAFLPSLPPNSMVVGDLNFDLNPNNEIDHHSLEFLRIMSCNGFYNLIETPTCTVDTNLISDHLPVIGCIAHTNFTTPKPVQAITKLDHCKLYEKISDQKNWEGVLQSTDPDEAFLLFTKTTQGLIAESSNTKTIKQSKKRSFNKPWMTNEIHTLIQKREKYLRLSRDEPFNSKIQKQFSKFRNVVADEIKEAKVELYKNQFETEIGRASCRERV